MKLSMELIEEKHPLAIIKTLKTLRKLFRSKLNSSIRMK